MKLSLDAMQSAMGETKDKALRSVAFRLRNRATSQAWSSWVGMWRDASAARARFVGVFSRLRNREMTQGWLTWLGWWQACAAQRTHLRRIMSQWKSQSLTLGWRSWVCMATERSEALRKLRQGAMKLLLRRLALGFAAWQSAAKNGPQHRESLFRRALGRLAHRDLSLAWKAWRANSRRAKVESADAVKRELENAIKRIQALERQAEAVASEMERQRSLHKYQLRESNRVADEMAERLAKAERIAERERLHRADLERELTKVGVRVRSPVRTPLKSPGRGL